MSDRSDRWILAFDESCGTCHEIAHAVDDVAEGRLEVLALTEPSVLKWRSAAFGAEPPFAPTLLRVRRDDQEVRGWTSRRMALPLLRHLGVRKAMGVLSALGRLRAEVSEPLVPAARPSESGVSRTQFLRFGAVVAGGLLIGGNVPAFAAERQVAAEAWVNANKDRLPEAYEAFTRYQSEYRREIFRNLPARSRAELWRTHLKHYRNAHPALTADQEKALTFAEEFIADESVFDLTGEARDTTAVRQVVVDAFGTSEAGVLLANLGPDDGCGCSYTCNCCWYDDYCWRYGCMRAGCDYKPSGCGTFWTKECNGKCP
ncbi:bacteriocin fulvocin C-related protein [Nonomuraea basaltis]|uniref:bacteriocin fulvocin C-related protein n=1 Tax=Nonomuraea basaltis TaxID=2495887 RepID=UPI00110C7111|nr:bacteriocin fulvocin C-related protein [Nonomuraea basaltis]TMR88616.1 bacteriocin fulvocin C-related protein [Nonomuraea basaltis]